MSINYGTEVTTSERNLDWQDSVRSRRSRRGMEVLKDTVSHVQSQRNNR